MNNRIKMLLLGAFLVALTGLLCLEMWPGVEAVEETIHLWSISGDMLLSPSYASGHDWTFKSKGLMFGMMGNEYETVMIFSNKWFLVHSNIFVVAGAMVVIPAAYGVAFSWIIRLRRGMKAQSPGAGSAERPVH